MSPHGDATSRSLSKSIHSFQDTRGWTLRNSKQSGSKVVQSAPGEPLPSFISKFSSAFSPGRTPTNAKLADPDALATNIFPTDPIPTAQLPEAPFSGPTECIPHDDASSIASDMSEEGEPDDQDGVHGNYHHVGCLYPP